MSADNDPIARLRTAAETALAAMATQPGEVYKEFGTPRAMTTEEAFREAFSDEGIRYEYVWNYPSEIVMRYPSARRW